MSSHRAERRKAEAVCRRKVRHETAGAAHYAAQVSTRVYGDPYGLGSYHCDVCGGWHVGHKPTKRPRGALRRL